MKKQTYHLPERMIEQLKKISKMRGLTVSELLRRWIDEKIPNYLSGDAQEPEKISEKDTQRSELGKKIYGEQDENTPSVPDEGRTDGTSDTEGVPAE